MKLTLRKANALQTAIQDHIKTIDVNTTVNLNEFQNAPAELDRARQELVANDARRDALTKTVYAIRGLIGTANATSGVSNLLADAAYIDKRIGHLKGLTEADVVEGAEVISGKLDKIRTRQSNTHSYYDKDSVTSGVLTAEQVAGFKTDLLNLKKQKQNINDKVLELNVSTQIELSDDVVALLQAEQLV